jgi:hypothetical protein
MDKENFIFRPSLDPLKSVSINEAVRSYREMLEKESWSTEEKEKEREILIEGFKKYKQRNKAE